MTTQMTYKLSDDAIAFIAKTLQVAIISGTDIVDNLRTMRLVDNDGILTPDELTTDAFNKNIEKMMSEVPDSLDVDIGLGEDV